MKFQVFKDGKVVDDFTLCGAYLFGSDGIAIRGTRKIAFRDGIIECSKPNLGKAGLALLWPIEGFGKILLPTACLPERFKPYILNVEIARAKLMQVINKREDWLFFNNTTEDLHKIADDAQNLFIKALQNISDASTASILADRSLKRSIVLAEKLTIAQAEVVFDAKVKNRSFGRGCLGCQIDLDQISNPQYLDRLCELFGSVSVPINWGQIETEKYEYNFDKLDACFELINKKKLSVTAGPLLCFSPDYLPKWLMAGKKSYEKVREKAYEFVLKVVERYASSVRVWCVISGLNAHNRLGFNFEQILEMTRAATMATKAASARSLKIIEIAHPWGEYYANEPFTIPSLVYLDMVLQSGINFDAFGIQMPFGKDSPGMHIRDMMQISAILDFFNVAKPIYISEVAVPDTCGGNGQDCQSSGVWHKEWDQSRQALWISQLYKIALSKLFVDKITYANLADVDDSVISSSGLLDKNFEPKKAFTAIKKLQKTILSR